MTIRTLDAEDLQAIEPLRHLIEAIDNDQNISILGTLMDVESVSKHLRSKYYHRPVELNS